MPQGVRMTERLIPEGKDNPPIRIVIFERETPKAHRPALLWAHGGGYVIGNPEQDLAFVVRVLDQLDIAIVSVDYRLAPEHPFPAPLDDCHTALCWLVEHANELGIDVDRIAIGGQSAGGGLAAALVQRAVDQGPITPAFQLLLYPMLDAQTTAKNDHGGKGQFIWTPKGNHFGWASYLGRDPVMAGYPTYAVPAQRADLAALPPAWIGVGTLDLFHDEDIAYSKRLRAAGVDCVTHVTEGGYHAFDVMRPKAVATSLFYQSLMSALSKGLKVS
jgi:acetyl esterase/lipase